MPISILMWFFASIAAPQAESSESLPSLLFNLSLIQCKLWSQMLRIDIMKHLSCFFFPPLKRCFPLRRAVCASWGARCQGQSHQHTLWNVHADLAWTDQACILRRFLSLHKGMSETVRLCGVTETAEILHSQIWGVLGWWFHVLTSFPEKSGPCGSVANLEHQWQMNY